VRNAEFNRAPGIMESFERLYQELLMPQAGDRSAFGCSEAFRSEAVQDLATEPPDAGARLRRYLEAIDSVELSTEIRFVPDKNRIPVGETSE
jgi:hypothetical protein